MKKRTISFGVLIVALVATYAVVDLVVEPPGTRLPAALPNNYEAMKACEKQDVLWSKIQETEYKELPETRKFGLPQIVAMGKQEVAIKGKNYSDFAPEGWRKYLHGRASVAKVKIVPTAGNKYTGIFQGTDCGILRISLTYRPTNVEEDSFTIGGPRPVAPGLALKVLRDGTFSTNISALVSLDGQGQEYNFFANPMSNIVPVGKDMGQKMVHKIFLSASKYPEELGAQEMAEVDTQGVKAANVVAPRQLFFVPGENLSFSSRHHEVREDFAKIKAGTLIYKIMAAPDEYKNLNYMNEYTPEKAKEILKKSVHIADIVTTSDFVASAFGDDGIFFRHQLRPK